MGSPFARAVVAFAVWQMSIGAGGCGGERAPLDEPAAVEVTAAARHTCARLASGQVACWGTGTLGDGVACPEQPPCSTTPVLVLDLDDATSVSAAESHTCAARVSGAVVCWGLSTWG